MANSQSFKKILFIRTKCVTFGDIDGLTIQGRGIFPFRIEIPDAKTGLFPCREERPSLTFGERKSK